MLITEAQLLRILPNARRVAGVFVPALNAAITRYGITSAARLAAFLAQVGHESAQLTQVVENLKYSAEALMRTWPGRFSPTLAAECARQPEKIANIAYASRMGNGAPGSGDGWRYRGRGLIQITGRTNYTRCGAALGLDLLARPELLEQPAHAAMSAGWYWNDNSLNALADRGDLAAITRAINGGMTGADERAALYKLALQVLL